MIVARGRSVEPRVREWLDKQTHGARFTAVELGRELDIDTKAIGQVLYRLAKTPGFGLHHQFRSQAWLWQPGAEAPPEFRVVRTVAVRWKVGDRPTCIFVGTDGQVLLRHGGHLFRVEEVNV